MERYLPKEFNWKWIEASRIKEKGRASAGILSGITKSIIEVDQETRSCSKEQIMTREVILDGQATIITGIYNNTSLKKKKKLLEDLLDRNNNKCIIIGGDLNARIGLLGNEDGSEDGVQNRSTMDTVINEEGAKWIKLMESNGMGLLNGNTIGDLEGKNTYRGYKGQTAIDYSFVNVQAREKIMKFNIEERIDSDHAAQIITFVGESPVGMTKKYIYIGQIGERRVRKSIKSI